MKNITVGLADIHALRVSKNRPLHIILMQIQKKQLIPWLEDATGRLNVDTIIHQRSILRIIPIWGVSATGVSGNGSECVLFLSLLANINLEVNRLS